MTQQPQQPPPTTITVDGKVIPFKPGQTVIQAAMDAGIYIPYLCYWPGMKPYGACRMCVVEVDGQRGTPACCTLPVAPGMNIRTKTPQLEGLRRGILELLLSEHPHGCLTCHRIELCGPTDICLRHVSVTDRCVVCPKNERCELKDTVRFAGVNMETPLAYHYRNLQVETRDPFYDRDYNLCIVCARCVRVCDEMRGDDAIGMVERSGRVLVGTSRGTSLLESGCEFCGACIDVCPVGALVEREHKWAKAATKVDSTCVECPVGCQVKLEVDRLGRVIRTVGDWDSPANHGQLCFKGKFGTGYVNHKQRIKSPMLRVHGQLVEASWDDALAVVAQKLSAHKGQFAILASPRASNEDLYVAQKFARQVMGTSNIDLAVDSRPELSAALEHALGVPAATGSTWELYNSRAALVVSANVTEEHNVMAVPIKKGRKERGLKLVVLDPREMELTRHADVWLRPRPGTEGVVLAGLLRAILDAGLEDKEFVAGKTEGLDAVRSAVAQFTLQHVAQVSGVPADKLLAAARAFGGSKPGAILYALDNIPAEQRASLAAMLVDLALTTGNVGKPSAGLFPLRPGGNVQGAQDVGFAPDALPGHKRAQGQTGIGTAGVVQAIESGRVKALFALGDSAFYTADVLHALSNLEFLVVQDMFLSGLAQQADVVLPATAFAETDGTITSIERRVHRTRKAVAPKGGSHPYWAAVAHLAQRMGGQGFAYGSAAEVFAEIASQAPVYAGMTHESLDKGGAQYGGANLYSSGFPGGKAKMLPFSVPQPVSWQNAEFPLLLVPGRVLAQPHREVAVARGKGLNRVQREEQIELHPEDARGLGIADGAKVEVVTPAGRIQGVARLSGGLQGTVSVTMLFGQLATILQGSESPDVMLRAPTLEVMPARVQRA
jgi:predicted molibdopterin-dependent oxidoreductase YjgC